MTLPYSHNFNSKLPIIGSEPTNFIPKIWNGLILHNLVSKLEFLKYQNYYLEKFRNVENRDHFPPFGSVTHISKIHTIREDKTKRWKEGNNIDAFYYTRKPDMFRIHPRIKCTGVQSIEIKEMLMLDHSISTISNGKIYKVTVDNKALSTREVLELAKNDGFNNVREFFAYFNQDFKGVLIHWTKTRY